MPVRGELRQVCPASQRLLVGPRVWWRSVVGYLRVRVGKGGDRQKKGVTKIACKILNIITFAGGRVSW